MSPQRTSSSPRSGGESRIATAKEGCYLKKDFTLEVVVTIADEDHITLVGLDDPSVSGPYGEPKLAAMLRVHSPH